jgi:hypothetical protein
MMTLQIRHQEEYASPHPQESIPTPTAGSGQKALQ